MATEISQTAGQANESVRAKAFYYSSWSFFWAMFAVAWSSFAHPFSYSWIDLETREIRHYANDHEAGNG